MVVLRSIYRNNDDDDFLSVPFAAFLDPFPLFSSPPLLYRTRLKGGTQVAWNLQAKPGRSGKQQQEQNSPNLGTTYSRALYSSARSPTQSVNCFLCRRSDDEDGLRAPIVVVVVILLPRAGSPSARARVCPQDIPCSRPLVRPRVPSLPFKPVPSLPFLPISLSAEGETRPPARRSLVRRQ